MQKNTNFFKSVENAVHGIISPIRTEANLRFHFVIANLICVFAYFYGISKIEWTILIFTICMVIVCELLNTAIENAVNVATKNFDPYAKIAKDTAAGAVLVSAIIALIIGFILFWDINKITYTLNLIFSSIRILVPCITLGVLDLLFLIFGGERKKYD